MSYADIGALLKVRLVEKQPSRVRFFQP